MSKTKIKDEAAERQDGKSISGEELPLDAEGNLDHPLIDTHRPIPKADGGNYKDQEIPVMLPTEHRDLHGNKPWIDDPALVRLRAIMEDYRTCVKLRIKVNNHYLAVDRRMDEMTPEIESMFANVVEEITPLEKHFKSLAEKQLKDVSMLIIPILEGIKGVGTIGIAQIITLIDIRKARYPSSIWKHVGYHVPYDQRYVKGVKGGGHKGLRAAMYVLGTSLLRAKNPEYREVYDRRRLKTENSLREVMHTHKENGSVEKRMTAWKDVNAGRRHNDAIRVMMKHFLADLWFVWRTIEGLETADLYVKEHLGHERGTIDPKARGWKDWE